MLSNFKDNSHSQGPVFCSHKNAGTEETWVPFLESHDNVSRPESYFMFAVFAFNNFENDKMKLSVKVCEV